MGLAWQGGARQGGAGRGGAWLGSAGLGGAWRGKGTNGSLRRILTGVAENLGLARLGSARRGQAGLGWARRGWARQGPQWGISPKEKHRCTRNTREPTIKLRRQCRF